MRFTAPADDYDRFMGRYTRSLAPLFADAAGVGEQDRVLDVGCGPGGLTVVLAERAAAVAAIDPAEQFAAACQERVPRAEVRTGAAEALPWDDETFDAALACLVLAFMRDPDRGVAEMARVTQPGGTVAACMWDTTQGGMTMLRVFWQAVGSVVPEAEGERRLAGTAEGDIAERFERAGLTNVTDGELIASASYEDFDDFWEPFLLGVGPAGSFLGTRTEEEREQIKQACRAELEADGPFELDARAWFAKGTA